FPLPPLFSQRLAESPWPTYRGNLKRTGRSGFKGPTTEKLRWVFSTGLSEKEGGIETDPVIGPDGTIYFGANNGIFTPWIQKVELFVGHFPLTSRLSRSTPPPLWISRESFTSAPRTERSTRSGHQVRESWER